MVAQGQAQVGLSRARGLAEPVGPGTFATVRRVGQTTRGFSGSDGESAGSGRCPSGVLPLHTFIEPRPVREASSREARRTLRPGRMSAAREQVIESVLTGSNQGMNAGRHERPKSS